MGFVSLQWKPGICIRQGGPGVGRSLAWIYLFVFLGEDLRIFTEKRMHYKVLVVLHFFCERQLVKVDTLSGWNK